MKIIDLPPLAEILRLLDYDWETGLFYHRYREGARYRNWNPRYAGKVAGRQNGSGYLILTIHGISYYAHRIAFYIINGRPPRYLVDHKDGCKQNCRASNLREASPSQSNANMPASKRNKVGYKGVSFDRATGKYRAQITRRGKTYPLGRYDTPEKAALAYIRAANKFDGEFLRIDEFEEPADNHWQAAIEADRQYPMRPRVDEPGPVVRA